MVEELESSIETIKMSKFYRFNINVLQNHMEIFVDIDKAILKVTGHTTLTTLQKQLPMTQTN